MNNTEFRLLGSNKSTGEMFGFIVSPLQGSGFLGGGLWMSPLDRRPVGLGSRKVAPLGPIPI